MLTQGRPTATAYRRSAVSAESGASYSVDSLKPEDSEEGRADLRLAQKALRLASRVGAESDKASRAFPVMSVKY
jgi:hypothetical protein